MLGLSRSKREDGPSISTMQSLFRAQARMARCEEGHTLAEGLAKAPCSLMPEHYRAPWLVAVLAGRLAATISRPFSRPTMRAPCQTSISLD
jgi:hypothetical protein